MQILADIGWCSNRERDMQLLSQKSGSIIAAMMGATHRDLVNWVKSAFESISEQESKSRSSYFLSQAKIRAAISIPICLAFLGLYLTPTFSSDPRRLTVLIGCILIITYASVTLLLSLRTGRTTPAAHLATIALDSAAITACVGVTGSAGEILIWLFLFITLGNGFRFGPAFLHACQIASLAGLVAIILYSDHWRINFHQWVGAVLTMLVVPAYANGLLRKLRAAIRKAEEASLAKSSFLARMSHELRTPLNGMLAAADLLKESPLSPQQQQLANIVRQAGRVLLDEIRDVLDISKIEANQITLEIAPFRLSEMLDSVHTVLSQAAAAKGLEFAVNYDAEVNSTILGDSHHLRQVVMNITGNAIKFTNSGFVRVRTTAVRDANFLGARVTVEDSGIGIPMDKLGRIFDPFRQADESTTRKFGGTGLGLSIARQLVRLMGGDIVVTSELNRGTRFEFSLRFPLSVTSDDHLAASDTKPEVGSEVAYATVASPMRILVADDNETNREVMKLMLEKDEHQVQLAINGEEALQMLTSGDFDLAILDHNMPILSGLDAIRLYRSVALSPVPTLVASADATPDAIAESASAGAAEHLCKPVVLEVLREVVARHSPRGRRTVATPAPQVAAKPALHLAASSAAPKGIVDEATLERRTSLSADPRFATRLIEGYIHDAEQLRDEIHAAVAAKDIERVRDAAHALKGGSATIGATALLDYSKRLQVIDEEALYAAHIEVLSELNELVRQTNLRLTEFGRHRCTEDAVVLL